MTNMHPSIPFHYMSLSRYFIMMARQILQCQKWQVWPWESSIFGRGFVWPSGSTSSEWSMPPSPFERGMSFNVLSFLDRCQSSMEFDWLLLEASGSVGCEVPRWVVARQRWRTHLSYVVHKSLNDRIDHLAQYLAQASSTYLVHLGIIPDL